MPKISEAVTCAACRRMHATTGHYIIVTATIIENQAAPEEGKRHFQRKSESIEVEDVAVCDNGCLSNLLSLKGFKLSS